MLGSRRRIGGTVRTARMGRMGVAAALLVGVASCAISRQEAAKIGRQEAARVERELPMLEDPRVEGYLQALGNRIARRADPGMVYRFRVVDSEEVNAFAIPGGYIYVNRGLIEATDDMAELAGVLAHEVAHVVEGHSAEQIGRVRTANAGLLAASVLLGDIPDAAELGVQVGGVAALSAFSRGAEREADRVAVDLLVDAAIDPRGFVSFLEEMLEMRKRRPSAVERWFATHPTMESRIEEVRAEVGRIPSAPLRQLQRDEPGFGRMKRSL